MRRCEKNEATLGYKMPNMHQAPVAVHCAVRIAEKKNKRQAAQVVYIAISATHVTRFSKKIGFTKGISLNDVC